MLADSWGWSPVYTYTYTRTHTHTHSASPSCFAHFVWLTWRKKRWEARCNNKEWPQYELLSIIDIHSAAAAASKELLDSETQEKIIANNLSLFCKSFCAFASSYFVFVSKNCNQHIKKRKMYLIRKKFAKL